MGFRFWALGFSKKNYRELGVRSRELVKRNYCHLGNKL